VTAVVDQLEHVYTPVGAALRLFKEKRTEVLLSGPAGTGKSRACLEKLHLVALANPGMRGLMVRKTQTALSSTALVTWREHVIPEALKAGIVTYYGGSAVEPAQYRYSNGSVILVAGMDKATKVMSSEYDLVYVQEAIELTEYDWEALTTRLRNGKVSFQQIIADTNPDIPTHWLKQRCDRGQCLLLESRHEDNPVLFQGGEVTPMGQAYMNVLDSLTGVRKQRLRQGLWVAAEGLIYEHWDPAVHVVDAMPNGWEHWTRWWSVDFGYVHAFALQWWAEDPDGGLWLYREILRSGRLVEEHAKHALDLVAPEDEDGKRVWIEPRPRAVITDHAAQERATLERHLGMSTVGANKAVNDGIQAVSVRMRDGRIHVLRDCLVEVDPRLREESKPTCLEQEIPGYVWDQGGGKALKEAPLKIYDDACDAMRYMVTELDLGSRPRVRWM
jgi:PBSX family phage terminase large subunit